jgi:hypothetical protein
VGQEKTCAPQNELVEVVGTVGASQVDAAATIVH